MGPQQLTASLGLHFSFVKDYLTAQVTSIYCITLALQGPLGVGSAGDQKAEERSLSIICPFPPCHNHGSSHAASLHNYSSFWAPITGAQKWPFTGPEVASHCCYSLSVSIYLFGSLNSAPNRNTEPFTKATANESSKRNYVSRRPPTDNRIKEVQLVFCTNKLLLNQVWFLEISKCILILYTSLMIFIKKSYFILCKQYI